MKKLYGVNLLATAYKTIYVYADDEDEASQIADEHSADTDVGWSIDHHTVEDISEEIEIPKYWDNEVYGTLDNPAAIPSIKDRPSRENIADKISKVKSLLASDSTEIKLHDYLTEEVKLFLAVTNDDSFKVQSQYSQDELFNRISRYEKLCNDFAMLTVCVAYWAKPYHKAILQKILARSTEHLTAQGGLTLWIKLQWYPSTIALYCAGIAAIEGKRYDSLANIFYAVIGYSGHRGREELFIEAVANAVLELTRANVFNQLPGHDRDYVPMSEHLFKLLQPKLDDIVFIGKNYEKSFDEFEVLFALAVADLKKQRDDYVWGPIGRFGWKHRDRDNGPLQRILGEAKDMGDRWGPIQAGLFGGSQERFKTVADEYQQMIAGLKWW